MQKEVDFFHMDIWPSIVLIFILIFVNAFFAMSEIAIISINSQKMKRLAEGGNKAAKRLLAITDSPSDFLATIQVGVTLSGFLNSAVAADNFAGPVAGALAFLPLPAAVLRSVLRYAGVQAVLDGVRPCVVAMILATAVTMGLSTLGGYTAGPAGGFAPDGRAIAVFVLLGLVHCGYKKIRQKAPSPIGMILLSAVLGIVFWH